MIMLIGEYRHRLNEEVIERIGGLMYMRKSREWADTQ
jgi:hypothetical protein